MKRFMIAMPGICSILLVSLSSVAQQRVGINNPNPSATLDVNGTIKTDSIILPASHYYMYSAPKNDTAFLGASNFHQGGTASGQLIYDVGGAEIHFDGTPAAVIGYCVAPLNLPNGAVISNLTAYVLDNSPQTVTLSIYETVPGTGANVLLVTGTTTGNSASVATISIPLAYTVDNMNKTNSLRVVLGNDASALSKLYGVRVIYSVAHAN